FVVVHTNVFQRTRCGTVGPQAGLLNDPVLGVHNCVALNLHVRGVGNHDPSPPPVAGPAGINAVIGDGVVVDVGGITDLVKDDGNPIVLQRVECESHTGGAGVIEKTGPEVVMRVVVGYGESRDVGEFHAGPDLGQESREDITRDL